MCFAAKKVVVVIAHQDDESLFFGGLLSRISDASGRTVFCMSEAKQKRDVEARNAFFRKACETVNARPVTTIPRRQARVVARRSLLPQAAGTSRGDASVSPRAIGIAAAGCRGYAQ